MINCIKCNKPLKVVTLEKDIVVICFECVQQQNQKRSNKFKLFS